MIAEDQQRFIIAMIVSIPLSYGLQLIPSPTLKHLYSIILGIVLQWYVFGTDIWMVMILHILIYAIICTIPKRCGAVVTVLSLLVLSMFHIYRMIVDYGGWTLDLTTILMTITCKYSLVAYAVQDGHSDKKLKPEQEKNKQKLVPPFLNYLSYCLFLPTALMGTAIQYQHFHEYMTAAQPYNRIPSPWKAVAFDFVYSLILVAIFTTHLLYFPIDFAKTEEFASFSVPYILAYTFMCIFTIRFKYYFAWKLSMTPVHASGISYQIVDGKECWNAVETCNPIEVEKTKHLRQKVPNWNASCQEWLRKCIYERAPFRNKTHCQALTLVVSAFWHGFYPGYYISFFFWFWQLNISGILFKESLNQNSVFTKLYKKSGIIGSATLWILANFYWPHCGLFFIMLSLEPALRIMSALYFVPQIGIFVLILFFKVMGTKSKKKKSQQPQKVDKKDQ